MASALAQFELLGVSDLPILLTANSWVDGFKEMTRLFPGKKNANFPYKTFQTAKYEEASLTSPKKRLMARKAARKARASARKAKLMRRLNKMRHHRRH